MHINMNDTVLVKDGETQYKGVVTNFRHQNGVQEILVSRTYSKEVTASSWIPVSTVVGIQTRKK